MRENAWVGRVAAVQSLKIERQKLNQLTDITGEFFIRGVRYLPGGAGPAGALGYLLLVGAGGGSSVSDASVGCGVASTLKLGAGPSPGFSGTNFMPGCSS